MSKTRKDSENRGYRGRWSDTRKGSKGGGFNRQHKHDCQCPKCIDNSTSEDDNG